MLKGATFDYRTALKQELLVKLSTFSFSAERRSHRLDAYGRAAQLPQAAPPHRPQQEVLRERPRQGQLHAENQLL